MMNQRWPPFSPILFAPDCSSSLGSRSRSGAESVAFHYRSILDLGLDLCRCEPMIFKFISLDLPFNVMEGLLLDLDKCTRFRYVWIQKLCPEPGAL